MRPRLSSNCSLVSGRIPPACPRCLRLTVLAPCAPAGLVLAENAEQELARLNPLLTATTAEARPRAVALHCPAQGSSHARCAQKILQLTAEAMLVTVRVGQVRSRAWCGRD
jgi:hypothetical protein